MGHFLIWSSPSFSQGPGLKLNQIVGLFIFVTGLLLPIVQTMASSVQFNEVGPHLMSCHATLFQPDFIRAEKLVFYVLGTGLHSAASPMHPVAELLFSNQTTAVVTFEKPGLPQDLATFRLHTQSDLVACAKETLRWAMKEVSPKTMVFLGHSDGGPVLLRMTEEIIGELTALTHLQLTSPMLGTWEEKLRFQYALDPEGYALLRGALDRSDEAFLSSQGFHRTMPWPYLREALSYAPAEEILKRVLKGIPNLRLSMYRGESDVQLPLRPWTAFTQWLNQQDPSTSSRVHLQTEKAGHSLAEVSRKLLVQMVEETEKSSGRWTTSAGHPLNYKN